MSKSVSTNVFKKKTGIQNVREYLEAGRSITPLEALGNWGIFRLASTVEQLRKQGVNVVTKMKNDPNGKTYAEYTIEAKKELKVGARVRSLHPDPSEHGKEGTVLAMNFRRPVWLEDYPIEAILDGNETAGLYSHDELEVI